jgi:hypothetical protein
MDDFIRRPKRPANRVPGPQLMPAGAGDSEIENTVPLNQSEEYSRSDMADSPGPVNDDLPAPETAGLRSPKKKGGRNPLDLFKRVGKKEWLIIGVSAVVIVGFAGAAFALTRKPAPKPQPVVQAKPAPVPPSAPVKTTVPSPLTGVEVKPELANRPVTGVMIENSPDARPQSGLYSAGMVFEAIAEGGITRFLTLFQEDQPDYIGPIRSARPYYLDWVMPFDAGLAHVGGSPDALAQIKQLGVKDLDQFANSSAYYRVSSRYAPHNMYSTMARFDALNQSKGYTTSKFTPYPRKAEERSKTPNATSIDITMSGYYYNDHYDYDANDNSYKRSEGGRPHMDEKAGRQIEPKTVRRRQNVCFPGRRTDYWYLEKSRP